MIINYNNINKIYNIMATNKDTSLLIGNNEMEVQILLAI